MLLYMPASTDNHDLVHAGTIIAIVRMRRGERGSIREGTEFLSGDVRELHVYTWHCTAGC